MSLNDKLNKILIIDFGSQFTQLIARRIREFGIFSEIISHKKTKSLRLLKKNKNGKDLYSPRINERHFNGWSRCFNYSNRWKI